MLKRILLAACLALAAAMPAVATTVLPLDLGQIVDQSNTAFQGTVVDSRTGRDPQTGMLVTLTTFRVEDMLKGEALVTYTIKQIGGEDAETRLKFRVYDVPVFTVGQSYVVFFAGVSSAGFSSPIGLSQGRFTIHAGEAGLEVGNGRDFRELTANVPGLELPAQTKAKAAQGGAMPRIGLDEFKEMVRNRAGNMR